MNERKAKALIEAHFVEPLPSGKFAKLWKHVQGCSPCKAHYDKLFAFEARFDGGKGEVERIGGSLFAALDPKPAGLFAGAFAFTWPFPRMIAVGAAALVLAVLVGPRLVGRPSSLPGSTDEFATRGGPEFGPDLLASCFKDVSGRLEGVQALDGTVRVPSPVCPRGGRLVFAYRNAREGDQLAVFAQRGAEIEVLVPATDVRAGDSKKVLPGSFAILADAPEGEVRLIAVFGPALDGARLQAALVGGQDARAAAGERAVVRSVAYRLDKP